MSHSFSRRNLIQNIVIGLLLFSAIDLFIHAQLYTLGQTPSAYISQLLSPDANTDVTVDLATTQLSAPVSVAVSASFGRYGSPHLSTQDADFADLGDLLAQALSSLPTTATATTAYGFRQAVDDTSVYFDFQVPLPCNIIAGMVGLNYNTNQTTMRRLALSPHSDGFIHLYWWDGDETYAHTPTDIPLADFYAFQEAYQGENVFFAFEGQSVSQALSSLDGFSLFLVDAESYPQLSATTPTWVEATLLTQLGFNPYTNARYVETNGTQVIIQEEDSVSLSPNGTVTYSSDGQAKQLDLLPSQGTATAYALASEASALVNNLLGSIAGDATLSISSYTQTNNQTQLTFAYQIDGMPITLSHGNQAASITLNGTVVTQLTLYPRQYYRDDATSLLLPLAQAAVVAQPNTSLLLAYVDYGTDTLSTQWIYQ